VYYANDKVPDGGFLIALKDSGHAGHADVVRNGSRGLFWLEPMIEVETPIGKTMAPVLDGKKLVLVSILRAGNGLLDGMLDLIPSARVGHIGLYRDHKTLEPVEYYFKVPDSMAERDAIIVDPMLATGNSAAAAVARIKQTGPRSIKFVCLLTVPEGLRVFHAAHPDVPVYTASIDERLNEKSYIVPGLGDAGDRMFGTK